MSDIEAIRALVHRYALLLDTATSDGIEEVFTSDAVFDAAAIDLPVLTGREAIRGFWHAIFDLTTHTAHTATNHIIVVAEDDDPEIATGTHYLRAEMIYKDGSTTLVTVLNTDTYRRTGDGWRIAHRLVRPLLPLVRGHAS